MADYAQQHEQAWSSFIQADAREHPQPARPAWYVGLPWAFGPFLVIAISGILLSALRTAPVFAAIAEPLVGQSLAALEAVLALIVIEVSIVVIRFITVLHDAQDGRLNEARLRGWMSRGFYLAFGIALLANVYASVSHVVLFGPLLPVADLVIATAVGISAPVLALVSGDILGAIVVRASRVRARAQEQYRSEMEQWEEARMRRWQSYRARIGLRPSAELSERTSALTGADRWLSDGLSDRTDIRQALSDRMSDRTGIGQQSDTQVKSGELVRQWLSEHPEDAALSVRALSDKLMQATGRRVSPDTINRVRREVTDGQA